MAPSHTRTSSHGSDSPVEDRDTAISNASSQISASRTLRSRTKQCPLCDATYTRTAHLNRHIKTHTRDKLHVCELCQAQFTRTDVLSKHRTRCAARSSSHRRACHSCVSSRAKCDLDRPCERCSVRGLECIYPAGVHPQPSTSAFVMYPEKSLPGPSSRPTVSYAPSDLTAIDAASMQHDFYLLPAITAPERSLLSLSSGPRIHSTPEVAALDAANVQAEPYLPPGGAPPTPQFDALFSDVFAPAEDHPSTPHTGLSLPSATFAPQPTHDRSTYEANALETLPAISAPTLCMPAYDVTSAGLFPEGPLFRGPEVASYAGPAPALLRKQSQAPSSARSPTPVEEERAVAARDRSCMPPVGEAPTDILQYQYLFYLEFMPHIGILHRTILYGEKTSTFRGAIHVCGSLAVARAEASVFRKRKVPETRGEIVREFNRLHVGVYPDAAPDDQIVPLLMAAQLLQTVTLFHHSIAERAGAIVFHGTIVMMIRRSGIMDRLMKWRPNDVCNSGLPENELEASWRSWVWHESCKRIVLLSYLHDACQAIFFGIPMTYTPNEFSGMYLPCEDALWNALSATEWRTLLTEKSPYGGATERTLGFPLPKALAAIRDTQRTPGTSTDCVLTPLAHCLILHILLGDIYTLCALPDGEAAQAFTLEYALHHWLRAWLTGAQDADAALFYANTLPLYWLGQLTLRAFQERAPPFADPARLGRGPGARFTMVHGWLDKIRGALWKGERADGVVGGDDEAMAGGV